MTPDISVVIPVYNEEGNISALIEAIGQALQGKEFEVLCVDDGSTDGTAEELNQLILKKPWLRAITLKRNFGQTAGLAAGIDASKGSIIIPMDGDGQNDPADIPILLDKLAEGYDVVSGWRRDRKDKFFTRILPSKIANAIISTVTGVHLHDYGCSLKAYRRSILSNLQIQGEMHRFLPAWCVWQGGRVAEVTVRHHPRTRGQSKYGMMRIFKVLIDLLTIKFFSGYLSKPNYLFTGLAFLLFLLGTASGFWAIIDKLGPDAFPKLRIPLLLATTFFWLVGIILILMGFLSELLVRLYFQMAQQKPYRLKDE